MTKKHNGLAGQQKTLKRFSPNLIGENGAAVAHNAKFDMAVLNWVFDIRPKKIIDTLSMARAIHTVEVGGSLAALSEYYNLGNKGTEVHEAIGKRRLDFSPSELRSLRWLLHTRRRAYS
jgi:DNA polymerase III epsilon subunit-like protein